MGHLLKLSNTTFPNLRSKKLHIKELSYYNDKITLFIGKNFNNFYDEIFVILKNIKTRDEYLCYTDIESQTLIIDLKEFKHLFTDYEGLLYIIIKDKDEYLCYSPILSIENNDNNLSVSYMNPDNLHWYIRVLENGELRLSSIQKNS